MVNKNHYQQEPGGPPPPMDETWWEAVLTEEESLSDNEESRTVYYSHPSHGDESHQNQLDPDALDWQHALDLYEEDQVVEMVVTGCNRGGLLVSCDQIQGFVPISHLIESPCLNTDIEQWLSKYLYRSLQLKVIECDQGRGRVVLSERAAQSSPGSRNLLLKNLTPGCCTSGVVTNITDFGVFVDLGGVEGLIHVSEISWGRVQHPSEIVSLGQEVIVHVLQVDAKRARVALSLKRMHSNPWETAEQRYSPGQIVDAVITSLVPFGAFARLEEGLDGLIHISEFISEDDPDTQPCLQEGSIVKVRILHVDPSKQRLGLSLKLNVEEFIN